MQAYMVVSLGQKMDVLWGFIKSHLTAKTIVFLSTCKQVRGQVVEGGGRRAVSGVQYSMLGGRRGVCGSFLGVHACQLMPSPFVKNRGSCASAALVYDGGDSKGARSPGVGRNHMH